MTRRNPHRFLLLLPVDRDRYLLHDETSLGIYLRALRDGAKTNFLKWRMDEIGVSLEADEGAAERGENYHCGHSNPVALRARASERGHRLRIHAVVYLLPHPIAAMGASVRYAASPVKNNCASDSDWTCGVFKLSTPLDDDQDEQAQAEE